jgi:hypothetical protein
MQRGEVEGRAIKAIRLTTVSNRMRKLTMKNMKTLRDCGKYLATKNTRYTKDTWGEVGRSGQLVHSVLLVAMQLMQCAYSSQR